MNKEQFLEDVVVSLYDGDITLEDIEEAYLNHELSNDDIDAISEAIDYIENQEPISEISADLAKKVVDKRIWRKGFLDDNYRSNKRQFQIFKQQADELREKHPILTKLGLNDDYNHSANILHGIGRDLNFLNHERYKNLDKLSQTQRRYDAIKQKNTLFNKVKSKLFNK